MDNDINENNDSNEIVLKSHNIIDNENNDILNTSSDNDNSKENIEKFELSLDENLTKERKILSKANVGCIRIWYFILNGLVILSITYFNDEIFTRIGWFLILLFVVITIIASYLFLTVRNYPGVITEGEILPEKYIDKEKIGNNNNNLNINSNSKESVLYESDI